MLRACRASYPRDAVNAAAAAAAHYVKRTRRRKTFEVAPPLDWLYKRSQSDERFAAPLSSDACVLPVIPDEPEPDGTAAVIEEYVPMIH